MAPQILIAGAGEASWELAWTLTGAGYEVQVLPPEELDSRLSATPPDLLIILADPAETALLIPRVRARDAWLDVPVVAVLPDWDETAAARALELGADEFLMLPFTPREMLARVAVLLRLKDDRRLLLASQEEFSRFFQETPQPLFFCDRRGEGCRFNPALARLLGFPGKEAAPPPQSLEELLAGPEDRERLRQALRTPGEGHIKVNLRGRDGRVVTVLLNDLALPAALPEVRGFQVSPVGAASPLKKALKGLVEHLLPSARDWLALLQLTPLLGGRYEKVKKLGQGSFGEVWLVVDTETLEAPRHFVAKIPVSRAANAKFRKEARVCEKLAPHPGAVKLIATLEDEGKFVLIQEYVEGKTLADLLDHLPLPLVERVILQLLDVVAHAHQNRIIHRDIKPNNIIIQPDGTLKLLDYGAAKILKEKDIAATMVGSRPFMAPEQILGKSERRSDIWAIGVLMYLLYTGELPFYSEVEKVLIDLILETEPTSPRELNPEIPPALEAIIMKCLKKKVDERYPQAGALKADLLRHFPHYGTQLGRWPWIQ
jgi:PAS domain S-box-containing protein